tara:strand:+ start:3049 stop:4011 length:963 start_codon:yes stop_codon:yes gene_type:complete
MFYKLKKISGDASSRKFYRIQKGKETSIIVEAEKDTYKNLIVYAAVNEILRKNKINAPKLINTFLNNSFIEISDLGKNSFLEFIKKKKNKFYYYKKIIDLLIKMQKIRIKNNYKFKDKKINFQYYDKRKLHEESDLFFDWYLKYLLKKKFKKKVKKKIKKELDKLYSKLKFKNKIFTQRDFHAANIMMNGRKLGVIDNQDAILGNRFYDLASLIDDVRIKIPHRIQDNLFKYYILKSKLNLRNLKTFKQELSILSVQRNLKILGIFVRLYIRDKKPNYLKYLPNTWELLKKRMKDPIFKDLKELLNSVISLKKTGKYKFK